MTDQATVILSRIEELMRGLLRASTAEKLAAIRADATLRKLYELTGKADVAGIAKKVRVSTGKISGIWKSWEESGLILKAGRSYRKILD